MCVCTWMTGCSDCQRAVRCTLLQFMPEMGDFPLSFSFDISWELTLISHSLQQELQVTLSYSHNQGSSEVNRPYCWSPHYSENTYMYNSQSAATCTCTRSAELSDSCVILGPLHVHPQQLWIAGQWDHIPPLPLHKHSRCYSACEQETLCRLGTQMSANC